MGSAHLIAFPIHRGERRFFILFWSLIRQWGTPFWERGDFSYKLSEKIRKNQMRTGFLQSPKSSINRIYGELRYGNVYTTLAVRRNPQPRQQSWRGVCWLRWKLYHSSWRDSGAAWNHKPASRKGGQKREDIFSTRVPVWRNSVGLIRQRWG
jgi:hypothetical protein